MITIDLKMPFLNLKDEPIKEGNEDLILGKILGDRLAADGKGDALKYYDWGRQLAQGKPIIVDESDYKKIYEYLEKNEKELFSNAARAQIMLAMGEQKEAQKNKQA